MIKKTTAVKKSEKSTIMSRIESMLSSYGMQDMAVWNTNAAKYISEYNDLEVHIVAPLNAIPDKGVEYQENGIHYHFFHSQSDFPIFKLFSSIKIRLFNKCSRYSINNKRIKRIVNAINPDIIHLIGAECPDFAQSILKLKHDCPVFVQLQALIFKAYKETGNSYYKRLADSEERVLKRADYIGTPLVSFKETIVKELKVQIPFLKTGFALTEEIVEETQQKHYDFVYFANNISKAFDLAIEAFRIVHEKHPAVKLDVIGGSTSTEMTLYISLVKELGLENSVIFEGKLPTHDDVLKQIRKSRYALLPLKVDYISGTIREAMANGLPVVTTITEGTPTLNNDNKCVLLSPIGDHQAMADNMIQLIEDKELANLLISNSYKMAKKRRSNKEIIENWHKAYHHILDNYHNGAEIPDDLLLH